MHIGSCSNAASLSNSKPRVPSSNNKPTCTEHSLCTRRRSACFQPGVHLGCRPYRALRHSVPSEAVGITWHRGWQGTQLWSERLLGSNTALSFWALPPQHTLFLSLHFAISQPSPASIGGLRRTP